MTLMMMTMVLTIMMMLMMMPSIGEVCPFGQHADNLKETPETVNQTRQLSSYLKQMALHHIPSLIPNAPN